MTIDDIQVHKTRIEAAETRADAAERRLKDLTKDNRTVASAMEKQVSTWGKKVLRHVPTVMPLNRAKPAADKLTEKLLCSLKVRLKLIDIN